MSEIQIKQFRQADHDIDQVYLDRWSPRSFQEKEVPEEVLMRIFEAARWAPSANNFQPSRFIIARNKEDRELFHTFINEGNRLWCEKAPVLAVLISNQEDPVHTFDAGTAWGYLSLQATREGLITHAMGGFQREKAREVLNIPDNYDVQIVIAIGYQGEKEALPENFQTREQPSNRRPLKESIFEAKFK
jgi:nitroreductase